MSRWRRVLFTVGGLAPALGEGPFERNRALVDVESIDLDGIGPEDVAIDAAGRVYGGLLDGRIMRRTPEGDVELFADTKGRPLGLDLWALAGWRLHGELTCRDRTS